MPIPVLGTVKDAPEEAQPEWIDQTAAAALLGVSPHVIRHLDALGRLTIREVPGRRLRARYRRDEILRLRETGIKTGNARGE